MNIYLETIIQGILQGLTEFLPVSSSGHLALFQYFFKTEAAGTLLDAVLHLGTLVAICVAFKKKIWDLILEFGRMIRDLFTGKFFKQRMSSDRRMIVMMIISLLILIPFVPFKNKIELFQDPDFLHKNHHIIFLGIFFIYTAVLLFLSDRVKDTKKDASQLTPLDGVVVGLFQAIALLPGVSRSGSTISGGLFRKFDRELAVEYSFILGLPTILASCVIAVKDHFDEVAAGTAENINVLAYVIGAVVSAIVGILAIKLVDWLVKSNKFTIFSIYTAILGIVVIIAGIVG